MKHGQIQLKLPDGVTLDIGVTQENESGEFVKHDDYCWIVATHENRSTTIDSYNMGLRLNAEKDTIILEDSFIDQNGEKIIRFDVV